MNHQLFIDFTGWIPAVIFPVATIFQLLKLIQEKDSRSVSPITWALFGVANIALYVYAEKYASIQMIIGFLGTAALDFVISGLAAMRNAQRTRSV